MGAEGKSCALSSVFIFCLDTVNQLDLLLVHSTCMAIRKKDTVALFKVSLFIFFYCFTLSKPKWNLDRSRCPSFVPMPSRFSASLLYSFSFGLLILLLVSALCCSNPSVESHIKPTHHVCYNGSSNLTCTSME